MLKRKILIFDLTMSQLIGCNAFYGYSIKSWNPIINFFLLGKYRGINILNLNYTYKILKDIIEILSKLILKKSRIWLVSEDFDMFDKVLSFIALKKRTKYLFFYNKKWEKGLITNHRFVRVIKNFKFPHAVLVSNLEKNSYVINECHILGIFNVSLVDTKENPFTPLYALPFNTKGLQSIYFFYFLVYKIIFFFSQLRRNFFFKKIKKKINKEMFRFFLKKKFLKIRRNDIWLKNFLRFKYNLIYDINYEYITKFLSGKNFPEFGFEQDLILKNRKIKKYFSNFLLSSKLKTSQLIFKLIDRASISKLYRKKLLSYILLIKILANVYFMKKSYNKTLNIFYKYFLLNVL